MTDEQIQELLPFRANGNLSGAELEAVEAALADSAELRAELAALMAIRQTMQADEIQSPGDFGLARLMREAEAAPVSPPAQTAANDNMVPLMRLRLWQAAAVAVLAVGIGFNLPQFGPAPEPTQLSEPAASEGYRLASGGQEAAADFSVIFRADATEEDIRALLLDAGLQIVSGPSALGLYGVGLVDSGDSDAARAALLASGIVEDVQ